MNLFLEMPARPAVDACMPASAGSTPTSAGNVPTSVSSQVSSGDSALPHTGVAEAYREQVDYDCKRTRRRVLAGILRTLMGVALVPLGLAAAFVVSYILTCILNGASPQELSELLGVLWARVQSAVSGLLRF